MELGNITFILSCMLHWSVNGLRIHRKLVHILLVQRYVYAERNVLSLHSGPLVVARGTKALSNTLTRRVRSHVHDTIRKFPAQTFSRISSKTYATSNNGKKIHKMLLKYIWGSIIAVPDVCTIATFYTTTDICKCAHKKRNNFTINIHTAGLNWLKYSVHSHMQYIHKWSTTFNAVHSQMQYCHQCSALKNAVLSPMQYCPSCRIVYTYIPPLLWDFWIACHLCTIITEM